MREARKASARSATPTVREAWKGAPRPEQQKLFSVSGQLWMTVSPHTGLCRLLLELGGADPTQLKGLMDVYSIEQQAVSILKKSIDKHLALDLRQIERLQQLHDMSSSTIHELHLDQIRFGTLKDRKEGLSNWDSHSIASARVMITHLNRLFKQRQKLIEDYHISIMSGLAADKQVMAPDPEQSLQPANDRIHVIGQPRPWIDVVQSVVDAVAADIPLDTVELDVTNSHPDRRERLRALGELAQRQREYENAQERLDQAVETARSAGASWDDVGQVVGITAVSATRRWNPDARRKHSAYRKKSRPRED